MNIKEVCEQYHISADTLRYYERVGMFPPVTRTPGGIRDYQEEDLRWLRAFLQKSSIRKILPNRKNRANGRLRQQSFFDKTKDHKSGLGVNDLQFYAAACSA